MRIIIIKLIAVLSVLSLALPSDHTVTIEWKDQKNITPLAGFSGNYSGAPILLGNDQALYLFWFQDITASHRKPPVENCDIFFSKSMDSGETWASPERLTWLNFRPGGIAVAISNNNIHVVYFERYGEQLFYLNSIDAGATWTNKIIFIISSHSWFSDISLAAHEDKIHIAWKSSAEPIFYSNSFDNGLTWKAAKRITGLDEYYSSPRVLVSKQNVYLFYTRGIIDPTGSTITDEIYYVKSQNSGEYFGPQIKHPLAEALRLAVANNNFIHLLAGYPPGGVYSRSADCGESWDEEQEITDIDAIAAENDNVLLIKEDDDGNLNFLFSVDNGASWIDTIPKLVLNLGTARIFSPHISALVREKQIHIAWELFEEFEEGGRPWIDYSSIDTYYIKGNFEIWNKKGIPKKR